MGCEDLCVFSLNASRALGERIAARLGLPLAEHEEREFEDGEHKARPLQSVRGRDVYVVQSLHGEAGASANDKLIRLLFFIAALRDASAARVTALVPYLAYARKDRRSKPRDPVGSRYVAQLFESLGTDRIVTLDVHNLAAYQNAFRIPADHLEARPLFVARFAPAFASGEEVAVVSPDVGAAKRAEAMRQSLARRLGRPVGMAFVEKYRSAGVVSGEAVVGDVAGKRVLIVDDLVSSGTTLARAAAACRRQGAAGVFAAATHGVFAADAPRTLGDGVLDTLVVTDSVPALHRAPAPARVEVLEIAPLFAEAIRRLHEDRPLLDLMPD